MNVNFNIDDAVSVLSELLGIACDIAQERRFSYDNREALRSRNPLSIANRLDMTIERYKIPIKIIELLANIADKYISSPQRKSSLRTSACKYCVRFNQQDSEECKKCHILTNLTDMIPVYAVMQKAGEKGIEWAVDWFLNEIENHETVNKIKNEFYNNLKQQNKTGGDWF